MEYLLREYRDHLEEMIAERTRELSLLNDQLCQSQKLEAVGLLAGGIAHDFSNILTTIKGSIHLILKKLDSDSPLMKYAEQVHLSVGKADLAQSLLAFSRKQTVALKPLDFNDIIRSAAKLLSQLIGEHIELIMTLTDKNPTVMADRSQIEQILLNLATNARDAMPKGGILTLQTEIIEIDEVFRNKHGYGVYGHYVLLTVSDTGTGMDEETKGKIFEPFFTTKEWKARVWTCGAREMQAA
jgi:signal transduction histidine kinase